MKSAMYEGVFCIDNWAISNMDRHSICLRQLNFLRPNLLKVVCKMYM